jgi:hypothetical protein
MPSRRYERDAWQDQAGAADDYGDYDGPDENAYDDGYSYDDDSERGLILQTEQSLVGVSSTVTQHGAPLLSYTRTMSRFYTNRRQRLSLGRYNCEVCGERIRLWAWETPNGNRTHDGCYERLAWTWTNLYAEQQRLAAEGRLE